MNNKIYRKMTSILKRNFILEKSDLKVKKAKLIARMPEKVKSRKVDKVSPEAKKVE